MTNVVVTGATGNVGSQVVRELRARGHSVRALVRDPDRAAERLGEGVQLAAGDLSDEAAVRRAMKGMDHAFIACANHPLKVQYETNVIDAAAAAGVQRVVKLSALGAEIGSPVAFWDAHGRIEQHLWASGLRTVVLQPSTYMTNVVGSAETVRHMGTLFAPADDARIAMIDPRDVGTGAAAVLTEDGHDGKTYVLTGPDPISFAEIAGHLSEATGRTVEFVSVPDAAARQSMVDAGMPEWFADNVAAVFGFLRQGIAAETTDTVKELTGAEPRSFADFARDHAGVFTG
ncbi:MAG: SDR family oxidoreductase [Acidimicrobiales bacterium]